jgi:hypothetical protein
MRASSSGMPPQHASNSSKPMVGGDLKLVCKISGSHSGDYDDDSSLGCSVV